MVSKVASLCIIRVLYRHCPVGHLHLLGMLSRENTDSIFENLPINLIWSDPTSSMAQSFSESISFDGGRPGMVYFVESLSLLPFEIRLTILLSCPTLSFGILDARTL